MLLWLVPGCVQLVSKHEVIGNVAESTEQDHGCSESARRSPNSEAEPRAVLRASERAPGPGPRLQDAPLPGLPSHRGCKDQGLRVACNGEGDMRTHRNISWTSRHQQPMGLWPRVLSRQLPSWADGALEEATTTLRPPLPPRHTTHSLAN